MVRPIRFNETYSRNKSTPLTFRCMVLLRHRLEPLYLSQDDTQCFISSFDLLIGKFLCMYFHTSYHFLVPS